MTTSTITLCRVRIVNDITGRIAIIETQRDRASVYFDLARMVRQVNRRRDETVRASLHLAESQITLHWHSPCWYGDEFSKAILEAASPVHDVAGVILGGQKQ
jgi:hypothetical protein